MDGFKKKQVVLSVAVFVGALLLVSLLWRCQKQQPIKSTSVRAAEMRSITPQRPTELRGKTLGEAWRMINELRITTIDFYGQVVDQDGKPLPGVEVTGTTGYDIDPIHSHTEEHKAITDASGHFAFRGLRGIGIGITPQKKGYNFGYKGRRFRSFNYARISEQKPFEPDRNKPVIFTMWKSLGAEPMVHYRAKHRVSTSGTPITIDLDTGKAVQSEGDIEIVVTKIREIEICGGKARGWDWSTKVTVINGGIMESDENNLFIAPQTGYKPIFEHSISADARRYRTSHVCYLTARGGRYHARIKFEVGMEPHDRASVSLEVWLNPSGSRNLEYDPAKRIDVP